MNIEFDIDTSLLNKYFPKLSTKYLVSFNIQRNDNPIFLAAKKIIETGYNISIKDKEIFRALQLAKRAILNKKRIDAIKLIRNEFGITLVNAKDFIEKYLDE